MDDKINVGKRIKKLREQMGLTQEDLAEKANISRSALANYESGVREPKGIILVRLAEALGTSIDYILTGKGKEEPSSPDSSTPSWWYRDTPPTDVELEEFLKNANVYFAGAPLNEEDKEDILAYLAWKWEREKKKKREKESRGNKK